jgi:cellulose synthase/poly-beta-1,6-N-acetylglucosamine synthase-like glycosyltransferase
MNEPNSNALPADWQVPNFEASELLPRQNRHSLVIPVINEGERVQNQLREIHALDLPVDVIVADGGSTDGSLELDFLKGVGVSALLIKLANSSTHPSSALVRAFGSRTRRTAFEAIPRRP